MSGPGRIFFALTPDEATRHQLAELQGRLAPGHGRLVATDRLHLTLVFVGTVPSAMASCCGHAAKAVEGEPFTLSLGVPGSFPRARIAWIGPSATPEPLRLLVERLEAALADGCGFVPEKGRYRPHVTLARDVVGRPEYGVAEAVEWPVTGFSLLESRPGQAYRVVREYHLTG